MLDLTAVARLTPGPITVNSSIVMVYKLTGINHYLSGSGFWFYVHYSEREKGMNTIYFEISSVLFR